MRQIKMNCRSALPAIPTRAAGRLGGGSGGSPQRTERARQRRGLAAAGPRSPGGLPTEWDRRGAGGRGVSTSRRAGGNERRDRGEGERDRGLGRDRAHGIGSPRPIQGSPSSAAGSLLSSFFLLSLFISFYFFTFSPTPPTLSRVGRRRRPPRARPCCPPGPAPLPSVFLLRVNASAG